MPLPLPAQHHLHRSWKEISWRTTIPTATTTLRQPAWLIAMGDTQAKIDFIGHSVEKIRLRVISYAGLSNDPDDVVIFLKYENVSHMFILY